MKKLILLAAVAALAMPQAVQADLVAGWDTWTDTGTDLFVATQTNSATGSMQGTITNAQGSIGGFNNSGVLFGASQDGTWGTLSFPSASTAADSATDAVGLANGAEGTFDFTVTAAATLDFTSFNFDSYRRFANSADTMQLSVFSGSITNGDVGSAISITQAAAGSSTMADTTPNDWDIDLSGLADRQLESGESAVFRMTFTSGGGGGGNNTMVDNVGIFATAVPEPSSLVMLGLTGLALLVRRRK